MMRELDQKKIVRIAHRMADAAQSAILPLFRSTSFEIDNKAGAGSFDPVTTADRAAEQAMHEILAEERPEDGVLGEEFGAQNGTSGFVWVLDPIDGTRAFLAGAPSWGVLIGLEWQGRPIFGLLAQPFTQERWLGGLGMAEHHSPWGQTPLRTKATPTLGEAILMTTFPEIGTSTEQAAFTRVAETARLTRYGLDCYAYGLLALGQIDLVIEAGLHRYDISAPRAIVEAAGGIVTNWQGGPADEGGQIVAAANAALHRAALELLQG